MLKSQCQKEEQQKETSLQPGGSRAQLMDTFLPE